MPSVIESKVYTATLGGGAGVIVGTFLLWLMGVTFWHASADAMQSAPAVASVPTPVAGVVGLVLTLGGTFLGGYLGAHTERPDLTPAAPADIPAPAPSFDNGGTLPSAVSVVQNDTGAPIPVEPAAPVVQ